MFCKYCGTEIADSDNFCPKCGKKIHDSDLHINDHVIYASKTWRDTTNVQWKKPIVVRLIQTLLLIAGLVIMGYGVFSFFNPKSSIYFTLYTDCNFHSNNMSFNHISVTDPEEFFHDVLVNQYDLSDSEKNYLDDVCKDIIRKRRASFTYVFFPLDYNFFLLEYNNLESFAGGSYYIAFFERRTKDGRLDELLCGELNVNGTYDRVGKIDMLSQYYKQDKYMINGDLEKYRFACYRIYEPIVLSKYRMHIFRVCIFRAFLIILLSLIWICKTTPKFKFRKIIPRDYADKIEAYSWYGFSLHKYVIFIKNGKYGILDAVRRCVKIPAEYDLIEWRKKGKSFDGVISGVRNAYKI